MREVSNAAALPVTTLRLLTAMVSVALACAGPRVSGPQHVPGTSHVFSVREGFWYLESARCGELVLSRGLGRQWVLLITSRRSPCLRLVSPEEFLGERLWKMVDVKAWGWGRDAKLLGMRSMAVDGRPAKRLEMGGPLRGHIASVVFAADGDRLVAIVYSGDTEGTFNEHLADFESTLATFRFGEGGLADCPGTTPEPSPCDDAALGAEAVERAP